MQKGFGNRTGIDMFATLLKHRTRRFHDINAAVGKCYHGGLYELLHQRQMTGAYVRHRHTRKNRRLLFMHGPYVYWPNNLSCMCCVAMLCFLDQLLSSRGQARVPKLRWI